MQTDISMCPLGPERSHHISTKCASQSLQSALDAIQLVPQLGVSTGRAGSVLGPNRTRPGWIGFLDLGSVFDRISGRIQYIGYSGYPGRSHRFHGSGPQIGPDFLTVKITENTFFWAFLLNLFSNRASNLTKLDLLGHQSGQIKRPK